MPVSGVDVFNFEDYFRGKKFLSRILICPPGQHPFVRPAFDTRADEAFSEIKRVLRDELKNR